MNSVQKAYARYTEVFQALVSGRKWWWDLTPFPYAALIATDIDTPAAQLAESIHEDGETIKNLSGWTGELNGSMRFVVAALLAKHRDRPEPFMAELERVRKMFRQSKIRRGGLYEVMAIAIMRFGLAKNGSFREIAEADLERFSQIHAELAKHQWWLTGIDDFPACGYLMMQPESADRIGLEIEAIYQQLVAQGFWKGNHLQAVACLLFLSKDPPASSASRFKQVYDESRASQLRVWQQDYDKLAMLCLLDRQPHEVISEVMDIQDELKQIRPKLGCHGTLPLACSLVAADAMNRKRLVGDSNTMMHLNAVISAQQAAVVASMTAASVAATTAASHSG